jgi:hypothetical protein
VNFEQPGHVRATFGHHHMVVEEHAGRGDKFSLWGPDITGRICRMGRYSDLGRAYLAARSITGLEGKAPCLK